MNYQNYSYEYRTSGLKQFGIDYKLKQTDMKLFHIDRSSSAFQTRNSGTYSDANRNIYNSNDLQISLDEALLIKEYRTLANNDIISFALTEIKNASFTNNVPDELVADIEFKQDNVHKINISKKIQNEVKEAFYHVYKLLNFQRDCRDLFINWYIDSRIVFHKAVDEKSIKDGIKAVTKIDPLNIKFIKEYPRKDGNGVYNSVDIREYYVYTPSNITSEYSPNSNFNFQVEHLKLSKQIITFVDSNLYASNNDNRILGHLWRCLAPFRKYSLIEDSMVIFRITRAPSRLVIYVDTANVAPKEAKSHVQEIQRMFQSKVGYNTKSGSLTDSNPIAAITENYFLSRNGEGKTTEITPLPSESFDGVLDEANYFKDRLLRATNVPLSRWDSENSGGVYNFGRGTGQVTQDEDRFSKYLHSLKIQFMKVFDDMIKTQLICKNIISNEEQWLDIRDSYFYKFTESSVIIEYKQLELLGSRCSIANEYMSLFENSLVSKKYIRKNILKFTDDEIKEISEDIKLERKEDAEMGIDDNQQDDSKDSNDENPEPKKTDDKPIKNNQEIKDDSKKDINKTKDEEL